MKFETETGSVYEVDEPLKRVRRLTSTHEPTPNQGDGGWKTFESHGTIEVGARVLFVWGVEGLCLKRTLTSEVTEIMAEVAS